ncbi:acyl-CoA dehydrogenase family protein [Mycobacterium sp. OTB74]|jgi:acyl-CoA dehydrogenase|uniref:acyl-CoA dehydrogenase family protein n=1 Tax=Mycobacterium sp. OTB74 TaxID=1853452 RepID=UPI0024763E25|nr:acyl-CoA dehydrogenase family protein [Mycobacterium sp. OTB74]MDH6242412.1 acyl-CoA dehydrogenase [Mycobacterium sp. OTB74]
MISDTVPFATAVASMPGVPEAVKAAADAADDVDRKSRFPSEAIGLVKEAKLLSCSLPVALGGREAAISELAVIARALGGACSSAGMVFAMHHAQALSLAHHASSGPNSHVTAKIAADEALLASATTELTTGGDVRSSTCAVISDGDRIVLEKNAPVISYAEYADYICTTARRGPDSPPNDQVLVVCPIGETVLEMTKPWDVLGFRGTCSPGYILKTRTSADNVVAVEFAKISETTQLPVSHTLWSSVWLGIADAAVHKARKATRDAVRKGGSQGVPQAAKLADLIVKHQSLEAVVMREVNRYESFLNSDHSEPTVGFAIAMNNLKLASSTAVVDIVTGALQLIGINGYREDHPLSMGRLLRDSFAPQLMVSNDRIRANNSQLVLMHRG